MKISKRVFEEIVIKAAYEEEGDAVEYMHQNGYHITNFNHRETEVTITGTKNITEEK